MSIMNVLTYPLRAYNAVVSELKQLRQENLLKLASLNARIESGDISGAQLDAVTECLEAQSVNIKKRDTKSLKGGGK
jgi:hypothetical protein